MKESDLLDPMEDDAEEENHRYTWLHLVKSKWYNKMELDPKCSIVRLEEVKSSLSFYE